MSTWLTAITAARIASSEKPAKGFKTREQIQAEMGVQQAAASRYLAEALRLGLAERRDFKIQTAAGIRSVPHYRLKKPAGG